MLTFIIENLANILIGAVLLAIIALISVYLVKNRKNHCGDCGQCPMHCSEREKE